MCRRCVRSLSFLPRGVVVGLVVAASTSTAELASFEGRLDLFRVLLFGLSGVLTAVVAVLACSDKKNPSSWVVVLVTVLRRWTAAIFAGKALRTFRPESVGGAHIQPSLR